MNAFLNVVNLFFDPETAHHLNQWVARLSSWPIFYWGYAGVRIVVNFRELMKDQAGPSCVVTKM